MRARARQKQARKLNARAIAEHHIRVINETPEPVVLAREHQHVDSDI
jgi:hypothetical protein